MNLKHYKYVLTLADKGNFSKAAEELGVSQPSLSQYVKRIEAENGVTLFERTDGEVRLTDAGRVFLDAAHKILEIERQMYGAFCDLTEHKTGSVVIGTSPYRSAIMMPIVAENFRERYPGMHIVVEEMTSQELVDAAERGKFDLCLTLKNVDVQHFSFEKIIEEELILAVPKSFEPLPSEKVKKRKYSAIDAVRIGNLPFVMITEGQWMQQALNRLADTYSITLKKAAVVKSLEAQIAMVRAGVGAALVPCGIERLCSPDEVTYYSFKQELPRREVVLLWRKGQYLSAVIKDLIKLIKEIDW